MPTPNINDYTRNAGLDLLRIIACFGVVAIHTYTHIISAFGQVSMPAWWEADVAFALSRWSVPAFVMISGYLLLGERTLTLSPTLSLKGEGAGLGEGTSPQIGERMGRGDCPKGKPFILKRNCKTSPIGESPPPNLPPSGGGIVYGKNMLRRLLRILIPLLFWSAVYLLVDKYIDGANLSWSIAAKKFFSGQPHYHLYFLFVILGLYVVTPLLNRVIARITQHQSIYMMLVLLGATMIYKWVETFYPEYTAHTNAVTCFIRFVPVYLLGYYLHFLHLSRRTVPYAIIAIFALVGCLAIVNVWSFADWHRSSYFMAYLSPFTLLLAALLILLAIHFPMRERKWIRNVSDCTLGIYLIHPLIVDHWKGALPFVEWVVVFLGSYAIVALLRSIRPMRLLVG